MYIVDNTQQIFFAIIYLKKFVLAVVVALPSYMLKVPNFFNFNFNSIFNFITSYKKNKKQVTHYTNPLKTNLGGYSVD
jgi:hypothetical protein